MFTKIMQWFEQLGVQTHNTIYYILITITIISLSIQLYYLRQDQNVSYMEALRIWRNKDERKNKDKDKD